MLEPHLAVVVLRHAPLRRARPGRFADDAVRRPADAERIDGAVQPVVHRPHQVRRLRLEAAAAPEARGEELLPVGDAVLVRVGVFPHLVFVGLGGQDRVRAERHGEAREEEAVDEHRVVLERAVTVAILVRGDAAGRHDRVDAVGRLFVAAQLDDEHAAVAVEGDLARRVDERIRKDGLDAVARRQPELLGLFVGRERTDRRPRREIGLRVCRILGVGRGERAGAAARALNRARAALRVERSRVERSDERRGRQREHGEAGGRQVRALDSHAALLHEWWWAVKPLGSERGLTPGSERGLTPGCQSGV